MKNCLDVFAGSYSGIKIRRRIRSVPLPYCRLLALGPVQQFLKLPAVGGDQLLFHLAALDLHRHIIVVGADQAAAPLKVGDLHDLRLRQMEDGLDPLGFLILQIEQDFRLGVVDDTFAVLARPLGRRNR